MSLSSDQDLLCDLTMSIELLEDFEKCAHQRTPQLLCLAGFNRSCAKRQRRSRLMNSLYEPGCSSCSAHQMHHLVLAAESKQVCVL